MTRPKPPSAPSILETALYADDLEAAEAFYHGIMGLEVVLRQEGRHVFFRCAQGMLLVFRPAESRLSPDPSRPGHLAHGSVGTGHMCFAAEDEEITAWRLHFEAQGIEIEDDFKWPSGARSLYIRDPAGNSIEFAEPRLWGF